MNHLNEEQLILHYYGEEGETLACEQHLESCEDCRAAYGSLQRVLNVVHSMPVPERGPEYGAELWRRIEKQVPGRRRFQWLFSPGSFTPWRLAAAGAFAVLLVASFLAGRFYPHTGRQPAIEIAKGTSTTTVKAPGGEQQVRERILLVAVGDYLERSHMMLIELVNANAKGPLDITSAQERAEDLLSENRLYRQTADHTGDTAVSTVLDELDRVLLDIAHSPSKLSPGDLEQFRQRLQAEGILFKIRVLGSNVRNQGRSRIAELYAGAGIQTLKKANHMIYSRTLIPTLCLLAGVAAAQSPAPRPARPASAWDVDAPTPPAAPAPPSADWDAPTPRPARAPRPPAIAAAWDLDTPAPPAAPTPRAIRALPAFAPQIAAPAPVPAPRLAPMPPMPAPAFHLDDNDFHYDFDFHFDNDFQDKMNDLQFKLKSMDLEGLGEKMKADFQYKSMDAKELSDKIKAMTKDYAQIGKFSADIGSKFAFMPQINRGRNQSDDRLYDSGKQALDNHHWDEAVEAFTLVASRAGARADGALYWKAYAQNKLGRRAEATAAIADLKKTYASSKWLDDAKALELEIQQSGNRPVTPESQQDEELKLLALNGIMQSDPERALPLVETLLKSSQSLKIRKQAVYVLAQSQSPKAQSLLEAVARGTGANPDLQISAIRYFGERRKANGGQVLSEVYSNTSDNYVKRAVINAFRSYRDKDRLLNIAKNEKTQELRFEAISAIRDLGGSQVDLWQIYQNETTPEGKQQLLEMIPSAGNTDKIVEVAKNEKDVKVRRQAIQKLGNERNAAAGDALVSIYSAESDQDVKRAIIDALSSQHNAKAMVAAAKAEKDVRLQQRIVERLANMKSPEATEYLMELLKK